MKVMHVVYSLDIGGLERVLVNCINKMPTDVEHHIVCLTKHSPAFSTLLEHNVTITDLGKRNGKDFSVYKRFYALLKESSPNVLHTYNLATLELQFFGWLARVPKRVHAEHGRDIYDPEGKNPKYRLLRKIMCRFVDKMVAVSTDLYTWLKDDLCLPGQKVQLIRNGINTDFFAPEEISKGTNSVRFNFGHVGRLSPIKNQRLLIEAYADACKQNDEFAENTKITIVGDGECREELVAVAKQNKILDRVRFAGAQLEVINYYHTFDVYVMTSFAEGIPMTLLEAMSCAIPAIISRVGGMPEVVTEHEGWLFESTNKAQLTRILLSVWQNQYDVNKKGQQARERIINQFSESAMVSDYLALYGA